MNQIPQWVYIAIGSLVLANLGTIVSILVAAGKLVWFLSELNTTVKKQTQDINSAHQKIRDLDGYIRDN